MALRMLLLRSKLDKANNLLSALREKNGEFEKREKELEEALNEVTEDTPDADREELENQINSFQEEKDAHQEEENKLENEIADIEKEIEEEEKRSSDALKKPTEKKERGNENMNTRTKFYGMSQQERDAFFAREDVKDFLARTRTFAKEKRGISGAELLVPTVVLDLIKENVNFSQPEISKRVSFSARKVSTIIKVLKDSGYIKRVGSNKTGQWEVLK